TARGPTSHRRSSRRQAWRAKCGGSRAPSGGRGPSAPPTRSSAARSPARRACLTGVSACARVSNGSRGGSAPARGLDHGGAFLQRFPPGAVRLVPADRLRKPLVEGNLVPPPELVADARRVEQITAIVSRAVGNDGLQRAGFPRQREHSVGDLL